MDKHTKAFKKKLSEIIAERHLEKKSVAKDAKINRAQLYKYLDEKDETSPGIDAVGRLAEHFNIPIYELMGYKDASHDLDECLARVTTAAKGAAVKHPIAAVTPPENMQEQMLQAIMACPPSKLEALFQAISAHVALPAISPRAPAERKPVV